MKKKVLVIVGICVVVAIAIGICSIVFQQQKVEISTNDGTSAVITAPQKYSIETTDTSFTVSTNDSQVAKCEIVGGEQVAYYRNAADTSNNMELISDYSSDDTKRGYIYYSFNGQDTTEYALIEYIPETDYALLVRNVTDEKTLDTLRNDITASVK